MKKVFMLATAAFLFSGVAFSHDCNKKKSKGKKSCCKKGGTCTKKKAEAATM